MAERVGFDLHCSAGRVAALTVPPDGHSLPLPFESRMHITKSPRRMARAFAMAEWVGFDLHCGAGRVAALTVPRTAIHSRSHSNPRCIAKSPRRKARAFCYGGVGGIRPALRCRPGRGSDRPPDGHSLPLPFESRMHITKSPRGWRGLLLWRSGWDSNPRAR